MNNTNTKNNTKNNTKTKLRKKLLKKCNLPDVPETSHCFGDSTHHTCCLLGKYSREYADSSGNLIGSLSLKLQNGKTNKNNLTPWCTCSGSKVCSYYTKKFGKQDGTHIKFIGKLKPVRFNWNVRNGGKKDVPEIGFIAQDLQQVQLDTGITIPNLVHDSNPEKLSVSYTTLLPLLVKSIQELLPQNQS